MKRLLLAVAAAVALALPASAQLYGTVTTHAIRHEQRL